MFSDLTMDKAEEFGIECDVEEVLEAQTEEGEKLFEFYCQPQDLFKVQGFLKKNKLNVVSAENLYIPNAMCQPSKIEKAMAIKCIEALNKHEKVIAVHHNVEY